ncbi:hypothetical protein JHK84_051519 [Glycine max]|nr:hypothetical protein JHK84_051519 [Glycine max]
MDASGTDIFEIYRRYCDIKSGHVYIGGEEGYRQDSDLQKAKVSREGSSPNWLSLVLLQGFRLQLNPDSFWVMIGSCVLYICNLH